MITPPAYNLLWANWMGALLAEKSLRIRWAGHYRCRPAWRCPATMGIVLSLVLLCLPEIRFHSRLWWGLTIAERPDAL